MREGHGHTSGCAARAVVLLSLAYLAAVAALMLAQRYVGERFWFVTWVTYAPQYGALAPALLLFLWSLIARNRRALLLNVASLGIVFFGLMGYRWHYDPGYVSDSVRIMTYNIHYLDGGIEPVARTIAAQKADVVVLQEVNPRPGETHPMELLQKRLPQYTFRWHGELAVGSRYPIRFVQARTTWPNTPQRPAMRADIEIMGRRIHLLAAHLAVAIDDDLIRGRWRAIPAYTRHSTMVRSKQMQGLLAWAEEISGPVIIAGDFNTPPRGRIYGWIARRYTDAFAVAGTGLGYTFRSDLPMLRIDYIFAGDGVTPGRAWVPNSRASDHKPLVAEMQIP